MNTSENNPRVLWIGGWAIPSGYMKSNIENIFPQFLHSFIHPNKNYKDILKSLKYDIVIGYSLGATLLLIEDSIVPKKVKQFCIAPFLNIKEATTVNETQLKFLLRKLQSDPIHAINDFYIRAQLQIEKITDLPYSLEDLCWGIEFLINTRDYQVNNTHMFTLLGEKDPLIDSKFFQDNFHKVKIFENADHNLTNYLNHLNF